MHIQQVTQQEKIKKINGLFDGLNSPFFYCQRNKSEFSVTLGISSACETTEDDTANKAQSMSEEIIRLKVVFIVSLLVVIWKNISLTAILIC